MIHSKEQRSALVIAASARANLRCAGMVAENDMRAIRQESPAYVYDDFERVIWEEGLRDDIVNNFIVTGERL